MDVKKVLIFTSEPFPMGMAASNRIISYAKGFIKHGQAVEVICFRTTEPPDNVKNEKTKGVYEGVKFRYLTYNTVKSQGFIGKRKDEIYAYIRLIFFGLKYMNKSTLSVFYSSHTTPAVILHMIKLLKGGIILKEENEHPTVRLRLKNKIEKLLFRQLHYQMFDGLLLITETLIDYFKSGPLAKKPMLHVPMMIDFERFDLNIAEHKKTNKIVYCGELTIGKDGVDILLKAFKIIAGRYNQYNLSLYGWALPVEKNKLENLVKELELEERVYFHGQVDRDTITEKLLLASVLVLPRPDSIQARHGFSTKLGEYLATGNPVLATSVGEIPNYLTDERDIFLAQPGDVISLAKKLLFIIENYDSAKMVASKGREFAISHFSNIKVTETVLSFVETNF